METKQFTMKASKQSAKQKIENDRKFRHEFSVDPFCMMMRTIINLVQYHTTILSYYFSVSKNISDSETNPSIHHTEIWYSDSSQ